MKKIILMWVVFLSWGPPAAYAAVISPLTMTLTSGGTTIVVTDQDIFTFAGDWSSTAGLIALQPGRTVGAFTISLANGVGYPVLGGPNLAVLNLGNFNVTTTTGGQLTVRLADSNYGSPGSGFTLAPGTAVSASATASGTVSNAAAGSSVSVQSWIDPLNSGGAVGTQVLANSSSNTTFGFNTLTPFIYAGGPFSMLTEAVIDITAPAVGGAPAVVNLASAVQVTAVPEPSSLLLLSTGLFFGAVAIRGRQRKRDRAS